MDPKPRGFDKFRELNLTSAVVKVRCQRYAVRCERSAAVEVVAALPPFDSRLAIMQGKGMWPMFAFGFGGIFVITQMHGLSWSRPVRGLVLAAYVAGVLAVYGALGGAA